MDGSASKSFETGWLAVIFGIFGLSCTSKSSAYRGRNACIGGSAAAVDDGNAQIAVSPHRVATSPRRTLSHDLRPSSVGLWSTESRNFERRRKAE